MKRIEIEDDLYAFIAAQTKHIGESASDILRRLLMPESPLPQSLVQQDEVTDAEPVADIAPQPEENVVEVTGPQTDLLEVITDHSLAAFSKRVEQFLFVLSSLHEADPNAFSRVTQIKGKNRIYFATSKEALLQTGSSTNPKAIPNSPYWVVTNNNTGKKVAMLEQVLQVLGYDDALIRTIVARFAPETSPNG
ncbi:replication initiation negative regulator SeqA [Alteromonas aestuariivivens]|uniref:Negative modulator of initiation of replication n=1 Tax=Alteromonas aestuariivivens TaxID=1938339 RepID=A0A3D8MBQ7_9ALTE|nr:replication initiation negative regulator SeqA [Alteromonas aestuariivivens]RDV27561.1 replication initiation negative regulator SeqA [Alteromonas aestuariivivens]